MTTPEQVARIRDSLVGDRIEMYQTSPEFHYFVDRLALMNAEVLEFVAGMAAPLENYRADEVDRRKRGERG